jgi:hypothetical protein
VPGEYLTMILSHSVGYFYTDFFFWCLEILKFDTVPFVNSLTYSVSKLSPIQDTLSNLHFKSFPLFFNQHFQSLHNLHKVFNFQLMFVQSERQSSSFIHLHVSVQFSQNHFLDAVFSPLYGFGRLVIVVFWVYLWVSYSICLHFL